ncbi:MAG: NAD(P)-binding domain-containing protein [candidate division KSB1 bacterium]|nr:NAD(P)-binding domain-containing protein [candidate division KSB1 bacterium]
MKQQQEVSISQRTWGFIGGGRATRILLEGFKCADALPEKIVVSDINADVLNNLKSAYPQIILAANNREAAAQDDVFLALHPPAIAGVLEEIKGALKPEATLISLSPKFTLAKISDMLGFKRVIRLLPLATSFINAGYNPCVFAQDFSADEKAYYLKLFEKLGPCPEIVEEKMEGYAMVVAMGPTYLWFQYRLLKELGLEFGLSEAELDRSLPAMIEASSFIYFRAGLSAEKVMDLIPVKPLAEDEAAIAIAYRTRLTQLYAKLKN